MNKTSNRQNILWVVATPIGNSQDMTKRAHQVLDESDYILCEDTRRSGQLVSLFNISNGIKKLVRVDAHSSEAEIQKWIGILEGERETPIQIALVTDAGTPAISDPGSMLVAAALQAGIRVSPVPGASAVVALLSVCGFPETGFRFRGFFPRKTGDQKRELAAAVGVNVWYESPQRIVDALKTLVTVCPDARLVVAKELTKIHEKIFSGTVSEVASQVEAEVLREGPLGEWAFALQSLGTEDENAPTEDAWKLALMCLKKAGVSVSMASQLVSQEFGVRKKVVYAEALQLFNQKSD